MEIRLEFAGDTPSISSSILDRKIFIADDISRKKGKQAEQKMISILRNRFPQAQLIEVTDVSGGCGAMFDINVVAPEFKGLNTVKQHRIINEILKEEIKDMHGLRIRTSIPQS